MHFTKFLLNVADYGLTTAESFGYRVPSFVKPALSVTQCVYTAVYNPKDIGKEVAQAGVSAICGIGGYATGDRVTAARVELIGKSAIDFVA